MSQKTAEGYRVACPRCAGTGRVERHANVKGGVCFACNGSGYRVRKSPPSAPAQRFAVSACSRRTGERVSPVFWLLVDTRRIYREPRTFIVVLEFVWRFSERLRSRPTDICQADRHFD